MSQPRFAPITASLLARKGEASPSAPKQPIAWLHEAPSAALSADAPRALLAERPPSEPPQEKPHRVMIALSAREYETLGIAAVKKNTTRHQIARQAIDRYFGEIARELREDCRCMNSAAAGCCRDG
jgi:hypothetical protein